MTNADKIRSMSDEELSVWIRWHIEPCAFCAYQNSHGDCSAPRGKICEDGHLEWLKQEHKSNSF